MIQIAIVIADLLVELTIVDLSFLLAMIVVNYQMKFMSATL